jgi:hypothetical protein
MKKLNYILSVFFAAIAFAACEKNDLTLTQYDLPADKAYVRFALLSPGTPAVMIKVNDVKINGANTGAAGLFPSVSNTPDYAAIVPNGTLRLSLPNLGTSNDSVLIFNAPLSVEARKFYAVTLADTGVSRTVFAIEDNLGALTDSGFFKLRLINAMPKSPAIHLVRVDSTNATTVVRDTLAKNIAFKSASDYIKTSISVKTGYSFLRFRTVASTGLGLASMTPPAAATLNQRAVTTYAYGYAGGTGIYIPVLSSFVYNQ